MDKQHKKEGGLRIKGRQKTSLPGRPLISVVTVSLNNREGLEATIRSVINQTYDNIEYLLIDGGSDDGSIDVIRKYDDFIDYWVGEPDKGIYDGMNKGISHAAGKWIIFMNSEDIFYSNHTVEKVVGKIEESADLVYGDWCYRYVKYGNLLLNLNAGKLENLWKRGLLHQALFAKTHILKHKGFDCSYRYRADFDFVFRLYNEKYRFQKVDETIATVTSGGASDLNRIEAKIEHMHILRKHRKKFFHNAYYFIILKAIIITNMKKIAPHKFLCMLIWMKHGQFKRFIKERKN